MGTQVPPVKGISFNTFGADRVPLIRFQKSKQLLMAFLADGFSEPPQRL